MSNGIDHITEEINAEWSLSVPPTITEEMLIEILGQRINHLIKTDISKLIFILYRIDVDEHKLKSMLAQYTNVNAGYVTAALVIDRQKQKLKTKSLFTKPAEEIDENEKW